MSDSSKSIRSFPSGIPTYRTIKQEKTQLIVDPIRSWQGEAGAHRNTSVSSSVFDMCMKACQSACQH